LLDFVQDVFVDGGVNLVSVKPSDMRLLVETMTKYQLDFDDAYQYAAAEQNGLTIISFDTDFDRTRKGKKTPANVLSKGYTS
jgi:predicted nucleic acid-binding protein